MARKKENVAALLSMYCDRVARKPRGPAPFLIMNKMSWVEKSIPEG
jgi:hypothetical protein